MWYRSSIASAVLIGTIAGSGCFHSRTPSQVSEEDSTRSRAEALVRWGITWAAAGDWDQAIAGFTEALQVDPEFTPALAYRARTWERKGEWEKAIDDYSAAIARLPDNQEMSIERRNVWARHGKWDRVIEDYSAVIEERPNDRYAWNNRAWVLATCPDTRFRDGARAVADATRACELSDYSDGVILDTLAAAYAENRQFNKAIEIQTLAIRDRQFQLFHGKEARERLADYQVNKPYREEPAALFHWPEKREVQDALPGTK